MNLGEKIRQARLEHNWTQKELAVKVGISERALYSYEQKGIMPRAKNMSKMAEVLGVSLTYLMDSLEAVQEPADPNPAQTFLAAVRKAYGAKGQRDASALLNKASAFFAGGELDDAAKEAFYQSLTEVYLESKTDAATRFSAHARVKRNLQNKGDKN